MDLPSKPVTLDVPQVEDLARHFSSFRHDVNGCLALVVAATELIRYNPDVLKRMATTLVEQPPKIAGKVREFAEHCERALGRHEANLTPWYLALWKRTNHVTSMRPDALTVTPDEARNLHNELLQAAKELAQLGFVISGARALSDSSVRPAAELWPNVSDQFAKTTVKFDSLSAQLEHVLRVQDSGPRRLAGGTAPRAVTLSPDQVALFERRLVSFERDMHEHLAPLLELSRLARQDPQQLVPRAGEFSQTSPKISAQMAAFATEFDRTFGIVRSSQPV